MGSDSLLRLGEGIRSGGSRVSLGGGRKCFLGRSNNRSGSRVGHDALNNGLGWLSGGGVVNGGHVVRGSGWFCWGEVVEVGGGIRY
jgi:hypothetical protein